MKYLPFVLTFITIIVFADDHRERNDVSPARQIERSDERGSESQKGSRESDSQKHENRTLDGSGNNKEDPLIGSAHTNLKRLFASDYGDGESTLAGADRPSPRVISNIVVEQDGVTGNHLGASDYLWQWGQFLDHDIDLTDGVDPAEPADIPVPVDDQFFFAGSTISFNRSLYDVGSVPRQQINEITAWIDASNVYGSSLDRLEALREPDSARLKTSAGNLLPFNENGLANAGGDAATLYLAGDVRANEQVGLTVMHTIFVREHNRLVDQYAKEHPDWNDDRLFNKARRIVIAQMQVITFEEFLPALLGRNAIAKYGGYDSDIDASIANEFSTAAYRFGHSALSPTLLRLNADGTEYEGGHLSLRQAFFRPDVLQEQGSLEAILRGLAAQECQTIDVRVIDDVRNFLFGEPPSSGFDLASLNIQRGRDHGLPSYNDARREMGLEARSNFADVSTDPEVVTRLETAYQSVEDIDLWVGGLAEDPLPDSHLGEVFSIIVISQFEALRDGDRYWYERSLKDRELKEVRQTRLADIIRRNSDVGGELPDDVFRVLPN